MSPYTSDLTAAVKALALAQGFAGVGIAPVGTPPRSDRFSQWLRGGRHADMLYMQRNIAMRLGVRPVMEGARSVICLAVGYAPPASSLVAAYAHGRDYHKVLKKMCARLMDRLRGLDAGFEGRALVDTAPVLERSLAAWSGLGWIGRNGCLHVPGWGSYVLLCEIVCNLPLAPGSPVKPLCGGCGACMEACPTGALDAQGLVDARRCVSYLTIECRGEVPREYWPLMGCRLFGCDRCQEVCPHNREALGTTGVSPVVHSQTPEPDRRDACRTITLEAVLRWSHEDWDAATRGSSCRRAKWEMFFRNAAIAAGNSGDATLLGALEDLGRQRPALAAIVEWAAARLAAGPTP